MVLYRIIKWGKHTRTSEVYRKSIWTLNWIWSAFKHTYLRDNFSEATENKNQTKLLGVQRRQCMLNIISEFDTKPHLNSRITLWTSTSSNPPLRSQQCLLLVAFIFPRTLQNPTDGWLMHQCMCVLTGEGHRGPNEPICHAKVPWDRTEQKWGRLFCLPAAVHLLLPFPSALLLLSFPFLTC